MTGEELFNKYAVKRDFSGNEADTYAQTLQTAFLLFGSEVYEYLEKAEASGKKIALVEAEALEGEPTSLKLI